MGFGADLFPAGLRPAAAGGEGFFDFAHAGGGRDAAGGECRLYRFGGGERVALVAVAGNARQGAVPAVVVCAVVGVGIDVV